MVSVVVKSCLLRISSGLTVGTSDLVHPQDNRLVLVGVITLDHQHRDAADDKDNILPRTEVAVMKGPRLGDFVNVARRVVVSNEDQVALAPLLLVEELAWVAQVLDELPVAVDADVEMRHCPSKAPSASAKRGLNSRTLASCMSSEKSERPLGPTLRQHIRIETPASLNLCPRNKGPADGLDVLQNAGPDDLMVAAGWHRNQGCSSASRITSSKRLRFRCRLDLLGSSRSTSSRESFDRWPRRIARRRMPSVPCALTERLRAARRAAVSSVNSKAGSCSSATRSASISPECRARSRAIAASAGGMGRVGESRFSVTTD